MSTKTENKIESVLNNNTLNQTNISIQSAKSSGLASTLSKSTNRKARKTEVHPPQTNNDSNSFLSIAPQQTFYQNPHQNLALASVQQQLQPGSVAVFTSPTMAMATLSGAGSQGPVQQQGAPQHQTQIGSQQQLVVAAPGQQMAPQFSNAFQSTGQTQLIQAPGMNMMAGLSQVQVIGANGQYIPQFYTNQMPQMLLNNLTMAIPTQNANQSLAIQLPANNTNANGSVLTSQITGQATPVKNQSNHQQTIVKGVQISPQQHQQTQATKTNANNSMVNSNRIQANQQQQTIFQQATFQQNTSPTFVISTFSNQNQNQNILSNTTPINSRKNSQNSMVQKIQPASSPIIAQAQFKPNSSFAGTTNANSTATGQAIMVHGQTIQPSIQLASNQSTFLSPLNFQQIQSGLAWPSIGQQSTQLMTPNGQILIRAPGVDQSHMLIQTSNNQFQAVPMQMTQAGQSNQQTHSLPAGQTIMTSPLNQSLPISIQTNQSVAMASTNIVAQPSSNNANSILTVVSSTSNSINNSMPINTSSSISTMSRHRPLRPASSQQMITSQVTAAAACKSKTEPVRGINTLAPGLNNIQKLAPKSNTSVATSTLTKNIPQMSGGSISIPKISVPVLPKTDSIPTSSCQNIGNKSNKLSTIPQSLSSLMPVSTVSLPMMTTTSSSSNTNNLVNSMSSKTTIVAQTNFAKLNKKSDKKDAANNTEKNKSSMMYSMTANNSSNKLKSTAPLRNSNPVNSNPVKVVNNSNSPSITNTMSYLSSSNNLTVTTTTNSPLNSSLNNMNMGSNTQTKNLINGSITNDCVNMNAKPTKNELKKLTSQTQTSNNSTFPNNNKIKPKSNENQVLTHYIDGYVIKESANPFPVNAFGDPIDELTNNTENESISQNKNEIQNSQPQQQQQSSFANQSDNKCLSCGKNERVSNAKKKKMRKYCQPCFDKIMKQSQSLPIGTSTQTVLNNSTGLMNKTDIRSNQNLINGKNPTKRTLNSLTNSNTSDSIKRPRLASPLTTKNHFNGDGKALNSFENNENNLEKMWLPGAGSKEPNRWTVQDVFEFISHLEGCADLAEGFKSQEIDGQALMLIKEDHIIATLNTKLGPALKICSKIRELKAEFSC